MAATSSRTAFAVFAGILLTLGVLAVVSGIYVASISNGPRLDARASLRNRYTVGEYVSPEDEAATLKEGDIAANAQKRYGVTVAAFGVVMCVPFVFLRLRS